MNRNPRLNCSHLYKARKNIKSLFVGADENVEYGHLFILNEYCMVKQGSRIAGRLPHGWDWGTKSRMSYLNNQVDTYCWSQESEDWAVEAGWSNVKAIGAPWLYMMKVIENLGWRVPEFSSNRTIDELWVYAWHSDSEFDSNELNLDTFIESARKSHARKKVVLLHIADFDKIKKRNDWRYDDIEIRTVGNRRNSATANSHLFNIYNLLSNTSRVIIDAPTTLMLYAGTLGCEVIWHRNNSFRDAHKVVEIQEDLELLALMESEVINSDLLQTFARKALGIENVKSPAELRNLFRWDEDGSRNFGVVKDGLINLIKSPIRLYKSKETEFGFLPNWNSRAVRRHTYGEIQD